MRPATCALALALATACACDQSQASPEQCRAIFERLIVIELEEMGFHDAALAEHKQAELSARYGDELAACVGRPLPAGAMECVASAKTAEVLSHDCLR